MLLKTNNYWESKLNFLSLFLTPNCIIMKFLVAAFIVFSVFVAKAQNSNLKKDNFKSVTEYNNALKTIEKGDDYFFVGNFKKALPYYTKVQSISSKNALLNFKIGVCYYKLKKLEKALPFFKTAKDLNPYIDPKIDFALAKSYQEVEEYDKAIASYQTYLSQLSQSRRKSESIRIQKDIDLCEIRLSSNKTTAEVTPTQTQAPSPTTKIQKKIKTPEEQKENIKSVEKPSSTTNGVSFRIQIAASPTVALKSELRNKYSGSLEITHEEINGWHKYFIGDFKTQKEALKAKELSGVNGAFIVKFKDGKKL